MATNIEKERDVGLEHVTARVDGLMAPLSQRVGPVELRPGEVWSIGRRDEAFLATDPDRRRLHLGIPDARPDISVHELELRVGQLAVSLSSNQGASVAVDGVLRPSPIVLTTGRSYVSPTSSGLHVDFVVTVLSADEFPQQPVSPAPRGTTLTLRIALERGSMLWRVAHALAWPCMPTPRRPHAVGWSGRDVAERQSQLGWSANDLPPARAATVLSQQLHALAQRVANCQLSDGRRADLVFAVWPPWSEDGADDETRDQRAMRRNRCVAEALWRARAVNPDALNTR
jgi:hypothetical protein